MTEEDAMPISADIVNRRAARFVPSSTPWSTRQWCSYHNPPGLI